MADSGRRDTDGAAGAGRPPTRPPALGFPQNFWSTNSSGCDVDLPAADTGSSAAQRLPGLRQLYSSIRGARPKSSTTETSLSSRPVIVRTYSGGTSSIAGRPPSSRHRSHPYNPPSPAAPESSSAAAASSATMPARPVTLPPASDFSFDGLLHAVEPEIAGAIDAIAAICARSKLSLADEYAAHRPPHEILDPAIPVPPSQRQRWWTVVRDTALTAVPEASSSSERLVGSKAGSRASVSSGAGQSSKDKKNSAYGSLRSIVSGDGHKGKLSALLGAGGDGSGEGVAMAEPPPTSAFHHTAQWTVTGSSHPNITLSSGPIARAASPHISLDTSAQPLGTGARSVDANGSAATGSRLPPAASPTHARSSSLSTWLPWNTRPQQRPNDASRALANGPATGTAAEKKLKHLLKTTEAARGRGKSPPPFG